MSYYRIIKGQRYDRQLLELAVSLTEGRGDGRISMADAQKLYAAAQDGRGITLIEKRTLAYAMDKLTWTPPALAWMNEQLEPLFLRRHLGRILAEEFELPSLDLQLDEKEAWRQTALKGTKVALPDAMRHALNCFLYGGEEVESPRELVMNVHDLWPAESVDAERLIEEKLRAYLNTGELMLIPHFDTDDDSDLDFNPPINGETIADNWIFGLYLPNLSDHYHWAVVHRSGAQSPYCYGFN